MPEGTKFAEKWTARFNKDGNTPIQLYAPYAYDAVMVVVEAVKRAKSGEPAKILAELPKTSHKGVTTTITFDEKGDLKDGAITLYQAKAGKWEALETIGGAPAAPAPAAAAPAVPAAGTPAAAPAAGAAPAAAPAPAPAAAPAAAAPAAAPAAPAKK
jgi:branched-chain amino acid transport system substrate-binding protein